MLLAKNSWEFLWNSLFSFIFSFACFWSAWNLSITKECVEGLLEVMILFSVVAVLPFGGQLGSFPRFFSDYLNDRGSNFFRTNCATLMRRSASLLELIFMYCSGSLGMRISRWQFDMYILLIRFASLRKDSKICSLSFPRAEFFQKICENIRSDSSIRRARSWFYATLERWWAKRTRKRKKSYIKTCFLRNFIY